MERKRLGTTEEKSGGMYFPPPTDTTFTSSGSALLNCVLAGGWAQGRTSNIIGDRSTGKTLLAIEGTANFAMKYPDPKKHKMKYREAESAFDKPYAESLGMPLDRIDFGDDKECRTVKDFYDDLSEFVDSVPSGGAGFYILDSLDALSDADEIDRDFGAPTMGVKKAKDMSELFRRLTQKVESSQVHLMIISQVRDNVGATFGRKWSRSGGRALDFYASQVIVLAQLQKIMRTRSNITRPIGIEVKAYCDKNKVGMPYRDCEFPIYFGFGIDDLAANLDWLVKVKRIEELDLKDEKAAQAYLKEANRASPEEYRNRRNETAAVVRRVWREIEQGFMPERKKYE